MHLAHQVEMLKPAVTAQNAYICMLGRTLRNAGCAMTNPVCHCGLLAFGMATAVHSFEIHRLTHMQALALQYRRCDVA